MESVPARAQFFVEFGRKVQPRRRSRRRDAFGRVGVDGLVVFVVEFPVVAWRLLVAGRCTGEGVPRRCARSSPRPLRSRRYQSARRRCLPRLLREPPPRKRRRFRSANQQAAVCLVSACKAICRRRAERAGDIRLPLPSACARISALSVRLRSFGRNCGVFRECPADPRTLRAQFPPSCASTPAACRRRGAGMGKRAMRSSGRS